ncbi:unnamed protein product [Moneuplotes crassus]|uniref:Translocon Sec61/SecY plug domain-containing protein n=2 Tax=Euplotes crassus TaxID=5936 RepID=A0AAD1XCV7_EUPCR|nr:unnamed protein product [Moneuplotes crassus]
MRPFQRLVPSIMESKRKSSFYEKLIWTAVTLYIYLICSQIPLYGAAQNSSSDPLYWVRVILASNRGTLMELGISPLVTSSMIIQLFVGTKLINVNPSIPEDKELLSTAEKLFGLLMTVGEAVAYVLSGMYGRVWDIGLINATLLILQLVFAGVIVLLLDEMLQKGYGLGSGISLFIATNICENIVWKALSPITIKSDSGTQFEGALVSLFHLLATKSNKWDALYQALNRQEAPNVTNLIGTIFVVLVVIYFQGFKVNLTLRQRKVRGVTYPYTIKLFYVSTFPIILQAAFISNIYFFSQILHKRFKGNLIIELLGKWKDVEFGARSVPVGGLAYYMSPPSDFAHFIGDPFHGLFYLLFITSSCAILGRLWLEVSGMGARDVVKSFVEQDLVLQGFEKEGSMIKQLNRYIPTAAALGGIMVGLLTVFADMLGAIGSGTGILLAVNIIFSFFEQYEKGGRR